MEMNLFKQLPELNPKGEPWKIFFPTDESVSKFFKELREDMETNPFWQKYKTMDQPTGKENINDKYNNIFLQIRTMFPWATDVRIEIDTTHDSDIQQFTQDVHDMSSTNFPFGDKPKPKIYKRLRTPFGMITLNKKDE